MPFENIGGRMEWRPDPPLPQTSWGAASPPQAPTPPAPPQAPAPSNYTIAPHNEQSSVPGWQSHHLETGGKKIESIIPGYKYEKDWTIKMPNQEHYKTFAPQGEQRRTEGYYERIGTPAALEQAAKIARDAGVPKVSDRESPYRNMIMDKSWQAALEHSGHLFSTTPLSRVDETLRNRR